MEKIKEKVLNAIGANEDSLKEIEEGSKNVGDLINAFVDKKVKEAIDSGHELITKDRTANYTSTINALLRKLSKKGVIDAVGDDFDILNTKIDELIATSVESKIEELETKVKTDDPKVKDLQDKLKSLTEELNESKTSYSDLEVKYKELDESIPTLKEQIESEHKKDLALTAKLVEFKKEGKLLDSKNTSKWILANEKLKGASIKDGSVYDSEGKLLQYKNEDGLKVNHTVDTFLLEIAKEEDVFIEPKQVQEQRRKEEFKEHEEKTSLLTKGINGEVNPKIKEALERTLPSVA